MKHLLAAATFATLLTAAPACAQTAYGSVTAGVGSVSFGATPSGKARANFLIDASVDLYTTNTGGPLDPLNGNVGAALTANTVGGAVFDAGSGGGGSLNSVSAAPMSAISPVPEPATWAMMLIGFAAVGRLMRTRRKAILRVA